MNTQAHSPRTYQTNDHAHLIRLTYLKTPKIIDDKQFEAREANFLPLSHSNSLEDIQEL